MSLILILLVPCILSELSCSLIVPKTRAVLLNLRFKVSWR